MDNNSITLIEGYHNDMASVLYISIIVLNIPVDIVHAATIDMIFCFKTDWNPLVWFTLDPVF